MLTKAQKAKKHLIKLRKSLAGKKSPFEGMSESAVIAKLRKDRDRIWESRFAARS